MIRGVSFEILQEMTDMLWKILRSVNVVQYDWYVPMDQREVWSENDVGDFFDREYYSGTQFLERIKEKHRIIFLKVQSYLKQCNFKNLHNYTEYTKSDCKLLLLIYDCEHVEVYAKSLPVIESIYQNARQMGYRSVNYITDENDRRTKMDIL